MRVDVGDGFFAVDFGSCERRLKERRLARISAPLRRKRRKILVIGSGGREHALATRLLACASVSEVIVSPGNAGTAYSASGEKVMRSVVGEALDVAASERPDLIVIGPEV